MWYPRVVPKDCQVARARVCLCLCAAGGYVVVSRDIVITIGQFRHTLYVDNYDCTVPRLYLDDSTQTQPPACPHGVGGRNPTCRIAGNGLHHPREPIVSHVALFLSNLSLKNVWWALIYCIPVVWNDKERRFKVPNGATRSRQKFPVACSRAMVSMMILCGP